MYISDHVHIFLAEYVTEITDVHARKLQEIF